MPGISQPHTTIVRKILQNMINMESPSTTSNVILRATELPADVILTILEELQDLQDISNLRLVSKQFDALIVRLSYRHVHLTDRIVKAFSPKQEECDPSITKLQVALDVRNHARHITINRALDWALVAKVIESLVCLRSFTWAFWDLGLMSLHESPISMIGPALCKAWPHVQLHFDGLLSSKYQPSAYSYFPNSNLISCKLRWEIPDLPMIKDLLFERPKLQKLHLIQDSDCNITSWNPTIKTYRDQSIKRLPALKELVIDGYNWNHSPWETVHLWDWSNITYLELRNVQVINFLSQIQPRDFSGLKTLIEKCTSNFERSSHKKKSKLLSRFLQHTPVLEELDTTCDTQSTPIASTIAQRCSRLRTLSLRSFGIFKDSWWKALSVDHLSTIGSSCPQLMEMTLDLKFPMIHSVPSNSSRSRPRTTKILTRSMTRTQTTKRNAIGENRYQLMNRYGGKAKAKAKQEIPHWYLKTYLKEGPGRTSWSRRDHLEDTADEQGISYEKARKDFLAWKRKHHKEEIATLRNQVYADPTPALARFSNLRRLTIYTRLRLIARPRSRDDIHAKARETVRALLNGLLLTKQGAEFEEVTYNVVITMVSETVNVKTESAKMIYSYAGVRGVDGAAEIREERGHVMW